MGFKILSGIWQRNLTWTGGDLNQVLDNERRWGSFPVRRNRMSREEGESFPVRRNSRCRGRRAGGSLAQVQNPRDRVAGVQRTNKECLG